MLRHLESVNLSLRFLICTVIVFFAMTTIFTPNLVLAVSSVIAPTMNAATRAELEGQLTSLESQIAEQRKILDTKRKESVSLERDLAILTANIKESKLAIQARDISIQRLTQDISGKTKTIGVLSDKLESEKDSLAQILRKAGELDDYTLPEFVFSGRTLSDFYSDNDSFIVVREQLHRSLDVVTETKNQTEAEKKDLEDKRDEQLQLKRLQELQKKKIEEQEREKKNILKISKGVEANYKKALQQNEKTAAQIRQQLFSLQGSAAIPFERAYQYALEVEKKVNIRPAFLLGIIAEESNLGQNVGTGNWKVDMHPTRDAPIFKQIVEELGLNPDDLPVSKKAWYGWGGAMGPAQFIPSTWILYKDRIAKVTGHNPPNPWNPEDAFFASGVLLSDNGASKRTRASERLAALRYLAGWKNAEKKAYAFYGDDVMELADKFQAQIDILNR